MSDILTAAGQFPWLTRALTGCIASLVQRPGISVAIGGSLARGDIDRYSDIDIMIVDELSESYTATMVRVVEAVSSIGRLLSSFTATHLGLDNLLVAFVDAGDALVKIDVLIVEDRASLGKSGYRLVYSERVPNLPEQSGDAAN